MNELNQQFIEPYETGNLDQFLHDLTALICEKFQCEASAIFLFDVEFSQLKLISISDRDQRGKPVSETVLPIDDASMIAQVFSTQSMRFSYDLMNEASSDQGFIEATESPLRNRLMFPLLHGSQCLGVLSVVNKYEHNKAGAKKDQNFRTSDFVNLNTLCSNLSDLIRIESLFDETQSRLTQTNASMAEMRDFNKVFLHEIRTPISKFTMAPEIIKRTLRKKQVSDEELDKVMRQLDDIQVMGDRLEFVAKTFNFNQIVTRRNFATLSVLRDIVFPVLNITRGYLRKQYGIDIQLETTGLQSTRVWGDKTLLNIVFNTLIDNAGKYSVNTRKPITISGGYETDSELFRIEVSNHGLPIEPEEVELLYNKGFRGHQAIRHGIGGTGIGLHLASRIMAEGGGTLTLTSLADPVTFTIRIPTKSTGPEYEQDPTD